MTPALRQVGQFSTGAGGPVFRRRLHVRYPDDFPEADKLWSGRYFVTWHETDIPLADFVEALEIAHETFVVRLKARQGRISYEIESA
jgi:hypothetical protein